MEVFELYLGDELKRIYHNIDDIFPSVEQFNKFSWQRIGDNSYCGLDAQGRRWFIKPAMYPDDYREGAAVTDPIKEREKA